MPRLDGMGWLIDLLIAGMLLEAAALWAWRRRTGQGIALRSLLPTLLAGLGLVLALRAVLAGAGWAWVGAALLLAGLAHADDLRQRWLAPSPSQGEGWDGGQDARVVAVSTPTPTLPLAGGGS